MNTVWNDKLLILCMDTANEPSFLLSLKLFEYDHDAPLMAKSQDQDLCDAE